MSNNFKSRFFLVVTVLTGFLFLFYAGTGAQSPSGAYNSPSLGGGLPAGLSYSAPNLTVSTAGAGNGCLALSGNTSGTATVCAPAVAGTITNGITSSNAILFPDGNATTSPSISFSGSPGLGFARQGGNISVVGGGTSLFNLTPSGPGAFSYSTIQNCAVSSASPANCSSANAGLVAVPTGVTSYQVNVGQVSTASQIFIVQNTSTAAGTRLSVTCNTTVNPPTLTAQANGSFTFSLTAPVTNPACFSYFFVN